MLSKLLAETDWKILKDFLSPSLFSVFPTRVLTSQARALLASTADRRGFAEATRVRRASLEAAGLEIRLVDRLPDGVRAGDGQARGRALLELYFHQLYAPGPTLLDLRHRTFARDDQGWVWAPGRASNTWEPTFLVALQQIYSGFYDGNDPLFLEGLDAIGARPAEATFREQFGAQAPDAVPFDLERFVKTFHQAFEACRDAGQPLHPQLIPLGAYLAALYEHLAEVGGTHDVRGAFHRARARTQPTF